MLLWLLCSTLSLVSHTTSSEVVLRLSEEVFDANEEARTYLQQHYDADDPALLSACVVKGASTPSYRLEYADYGAVCVTRPWRVVTWIADAETMCECA